MAEFFYNNWVSIIGASIGLLYLLLEYKANIWMWVVGVFMSVFYIYIFYATKLYASMGIYIYFLLASVYGLVMWSTKYKKKTVDDKSISRMDKKWIPVIVVAIILIKLILYLLLDFFAVYKPIITQGDALTTSLNFVALWMMSRKWVEQWLLLIPANALSSILLFMQNDRVSGSLFFVYFVVSITGFYKWKRMVLGTKSQVEIY